MSKLNTLGITRSLSSKYVELKKNLNNTNFKSFKRISLNDSGILINDNGKINLISQNENNLAEMSNWHLPPKYVELYDSTNDIIKEILIKFARLQEDQQKRIIPKFEDEENKKIDKLIRYNIKDLTDKIRDCEDNIKKMGFEKLRYEKEATVRDNMKQNLLTKISDFTKKLKLNEEEYMRKYKELVGEEIKYSPSNSTNIESNLNSMDTKNNFLKVENNNDILMKRDNEINNLINSINQLASIFKDFQVLVLEQGTILDRVDYNIDASLKNIKDGQEQLLKAEKNMRNSCARNVNITLITIIFLMAILLIFKYIK